MTSFKRLYPAKDFCHARRKPKRRRNDRRTSIDDVCLVNNHWLSFAVNVLTVKGLQHCWERDVLSCKHLHHQQPSEISTGLKRLFAKKFSRRGRRRYCLHRGGWGVWTRLAEVRDWLPSPAPYLIYCLGRTASLRGKDKDLIVNSKQNVATGTQASVIVPVLSPGKYRGL